MRHVGAMAQAVADPASENEGAANLARGLSAELDRDMGLADFVRTSWEQHLEPDTEFVDGWHIDYLCEFLEWIADSVDPNTKLTQKQRLNRLCINWPPRNTKSTIVSVCFPAWLWGPRNLPAISLVSASHSHTLSKKHSNDRRELIQSAWYQERWGAQFALSDVQNEKVDFENTRKGRMLATSVGGGTTGRGGRILIGDDLMDPEQAESDAHRDRCLKWVKRVFLSRLDDKKNGAIIFMEQRTHHKDVTAMVEKSGGYTHVSLPATQGKKVERLAFPLSGRIVTRKPGEVLSPNREDAATLAQIAIDMGSRAYGAQYNQDPTPEEGNYVKLGWWKHWLSLPKWKDVEIRIQSWDLAWKEGEKNDYTVKSTWNKTKEAFFKESQLRRRMESPESVRMIEEEYHKEHAIHPIRAVLIEDAAAGIHAIQALKKKRIPIIGVKAIKSKVLRVNDVAPLIESGRVQIPAESEWTEQYKTRFAKFPDVDFDDEMDADTQALTWLDGKQKKVLKMRGE